MNKNTLLGIVIGGVITIVSAYYYFDLGKNRRVPVYQFKNRSSLIFDKSNYTSKIKLLFNDSTVVSENVYLSTLVFWNKGNLPIIKEDVRKDLYLYCTDSTSKILDYKILSQKESGISNFTLLQTHNKLKINWDYFDPGFGFLVQIIYTGTKSTEIKISGYVLGTEVKELPISVGLTRWYRGLLLVYLCTIPFYIISIWKISRQKKEELNEMTVRFFKYEIKRHYVTIAWFTFLIATVLLFLILKDILLVNAPF
jgi:hypothetical protein